MFSGVAVALPAMGEDLRFSATTLGLIETIFLASSTAFLLPGGRLADMLPRGVIFRATLFGFGLMSLLIGCVSEAWAVLLLRFLQGLVAALSGAAGPALLGDLVPAERRGRVFGSMLGMAYAGLALGPLAAGWLVATYGWRSVFFVGAAQILIGGLPVLLRRIDRWRAPTGGMHVPSTVLVVLGMGCVVGAVSVGGHGGSPWPWAASAAALLLAFVAWQTRLRDPLLDLRALRQSPALRSALLVQVLLYLNAYCSIFLLSLFLQVGLGLDERTAGLWLAVGAVVMALVAPRAGRLADRFRPQIVAAVGTTFVFASSIVGWSLHAGSPPWMVGAILATQGVGFGLFSSPNLTLILRCAPPNRSGFASAIAAQSRGIGMFSGMAVSSALLASHFGERSVQGDPVGVIETLHGAYGVLLATSALALLFAFGRGAFRR